MTSDIKPVGEAVGCVQVDLQKLFQPPVGATVYENSGARHAKLADGRVLQVWPIPEGLATKDGFRAWADSVFFWFSDAEYQEARAQHDRLELLDRAGGRQHGPKDPAADFLADWRRLAQKHNSDGTERGAAMADLVVIHLCQFPSRGWTAAVLKVIREFGYTDVRDSVVDLIREKTPGPDAIKFLAHRCRLLKELVAAHG